MKVLVTGAAGFIGMHVCERLLARGDDVFGVDNLSDYYDVSLKGARLARLRAWDRFVFERLDIADPCGLAAAFARHSPQRVIHLAAQAGVRYSVKNPLHSVRANVLGSVNVFEASRQAGIDHLVFASSSSVYGANARYPWREVENVDHPLSLYAATKKSSELMAHAYAHLHRMPMTGLRFFTVYGPWGRPDMAPWLFARAITRGEPLSVFNHGRMQRDFTYIDDVADAVVRVCDKPATPDPAFDRSDPDPARSDAPWRIFNVGNRQPVGLDQFIESLEQALGRSAAKTLLSMQPGDVEVTAADTAALHAWIDFEPGTPLKEGLGRFARWYLQHQGGSSVPGA